MLNSMNNTSLFCNYYRQWVDVYKKGAIREATMSKYMMTLKWLEKLVPELTLAELTRTAYQKLLNDYAKEHERQTTLDFHHQLKGAILDAVDEGLIERDPTRKAIIKGKTPKTKKIKYLNQFELHTLIAHLELKEEASWDWFILLVAKTGMRFSEALAITPADFDFARQTLSISKTWDYKGDGGFLPTKNKSSVRKIQIDWQIVVKFSELGDFIYKPVRSYSSGMYSKLAFSITAILETDIMLIDEVLSVGDIRFKEKSYNKMKELINDTNRTVIIVSHSSKTLTELCDKVIWLHDGLIKDIGPSKEIVKKYEEYMDFQKKNDI